MSDCKRDGHLEEDVSDESSLIDSENEIISDPGESADELHLNEQEEAKLDDASDSEKKDEECAEVITLSLGNEYDTLKELKDAIFQYSVKNRKNVKFTKSESDRLTTCCCFSGCRWRLHDSFHSGSKKFRIKSFLDEHSCIDTEKNKLFKIPRLVDIFLDMIRENPSLKPAEMRGHILLEYKVRVSLPQCQAARHRCLQQLKREQVEQFERLWDYVNELKRSNPGSTIELETEGGVFTRMYIMFGDLKEGWRHCRQMIHLDGAFLKWQLKGELVSAVARDANDQIFPVAWAIVDVENKRNWSWFIQHLKEDIDLGIGDGLAIMSGQQKGIILSVAEHLPTAEHRMCARHIWANLKKKCNDDEIRFLFWNAAKSYTESNFRLNMEKIKEVSDIAYTELEKNNPMHWCRAFFSIFCKCDSVDNNFSESFNASIRDARKQPVVKMLETIRQNVMLSHGKKLTASRSHNQILSPKAQELLDAQKEVANACKVLNNGRRMFEVTYKGCSFSVNLAYIGYSCPCRYKDVSGILCGHLIAAGWEDSEGRLQPEYVVSECWKTEQWRKTYASALLPVNGMSL